MPAAAAWNHTPTRRVLRQVRDESSSGLSAAALRETERGFRAKLVARRLSPAFIERYFDEVMSQARQEYAAWLKDGHEADNPVGWLINCAWWRLLDLLDRERRRPQSVSLEVSCRPPLRAAALRLRPLLERDLGAGARPSRSRH